MADEITQTGRPMKITTPLPPNDLLVVGISGHEGLSELFDYQLDLIAPNGKNIPFDKLLGQKISVELTLPKGKKRHFTGICSRVAQGDSNLVFTSYHMDVVPQLWLLSAKTRSRIFQQQSVPDILKKILKDEGGIDLDSKIKGKFEPRDFVVQYRESDFNFVSRLMEEEGIWYFFTHTADGHKMVLGNTPGDHPAMPEQDTINYKVPQDKEQDEQQEFIITWIKRQELRSGKYTLFDHSFELAHKHLEAEKTIVDTVQVGEVPHKMKVGGNDKLEIFDYPGGYAQRFDGVDKGGGEQPKELEKIFEDNKRTVAIRMEQQQMPGVVIDGSSNCRHLIPGHTFKVKTPDRPDAKLAKADGKYLLTHVSFATTQGEFRSGEGLTFHYHNTFVCLPFDVPYRPLRTSPKPTIPGPQTAVVVGPKGEEISTDKFGRVKVQFHWDREGKNDASSSCWVRVAQLWAGKRWGASFWPRIGQEVVVAFEEGDPDRPIIVGSVYNSEQLPPYLGDGPDAKHKKDNKVSGIKTNTTPGGVGFNELRFDDTKDKQQVFIHAERDMDTRVKNETRELVLLNRHLIVGGEKDGKKQGDQRELVHKDKHLHVKGDHVEHVEGSMLLLVGGGDGSDPGNQDIIIKKNKKELIEENSHLHVKKNRNEQVDGAQSLTVGGTQHQKMGKGFLLEAGSVVHIKAGTAMVLEAGMQISLKVGGNFIDISPAGIAINGMPMVMINSGGAAASTDPAKPTAPEDAKEAKPTKPDVADDAKTGQKSAP